MNYKLFILFVFLAIISIFIFYSINICNRTEFEMVEQCKVILGMEKIKG